MKDHDKRLKQLEEKMSNKRTHFIWQEPGQSEQQARSVYTRHIGLHDRLRFIGWGATQKSGEEEVSHEQKH